MPKITDDHAKAGGHSAAASKANAFSTPPKRDEALTERILLSGGGYKVVFPPDWHKKNGRKGGEETLSSAESGAPRFKLGDHPLDVDVLTRLNFLPVHRHGFAKDKKQRS